MSLLHHLGCAFGLCAGLAVQAGESAQELVAAIWKQYGAVPRYSCVYLVERIPDAQLLQKGMPFRTSSYGINRRPGWLALKHEEVPVAAWASSTFGMQPAWQWVRGPLRSEWFDGATGRLAIRWLPPQGREAKRIPPLHGDPDCTHPVFAPLSDFTMDGAMGEVSQARLGLFVHLATGAGAAPDVSSWKSTPGEANQIILEKSYGNEGVSRDQQVVIKRKAGEKPLYRCRITIETRDGLPCVVRRETIPDDNRIDAIRWDYTYRAIAGATLLDSGITTIQPAGTVVGRTRLESCVTDREPPDAAFHISPAQAKTVYDETARMAIDIPAP